MALDSAVSPERRYSTSLGVDTVLAHDFITTLNLGGFRELRRIRQNEKSRPKVVGFFIFEDRVWL